MKRNHVTVFYAHCSGVKWVTPEASDIVFARAYGIGPVLVDPDWATLHFEPFGEIHLKKLPEDQLDRHTSFIQPYQRFRDSLTAADWLDSTTSDVIVLPVSTIHFREVSDGTYADMADYLRTPIAVA